MADPDKFVFVNYSGEPEVEAKQSLTTIRQHVTQNYLRQERGTGNDVLLEGSTKHQGKHTEAASQPYVKRTRPRRGRPRPDGSRHVTPPSCDSGIGMLENDRDDKLDQGFRLFTFSSDDDQSEFLSDTDSRTSSGTSMDDLDDLDKHFLDMECCRLRSWLLIRLRSEPFLENLQHRLAYLRQASSTPQDQPANSASRSTSGSSSSSPSTSSSIPTTVSGGTSGVSKRRRDDGSGKDELQKKKRRIPLKEPNLKSTPPRLACFYNKYDPMMYRSSARTRKRFEICATHDFQNINKLFEHLKRVHSSQPVQCPRCTRTDFRTAEELLAHQTASEACLYVPLTQVKRIKWIGDEQRLALQSDVAKELRGRSDEAKWRFAYTRLFPEISPDNVPSPFFQDPIISVASFVVDQYETRLRSEIRESNDLSGLESRIPAILEDFLAQYGIVTNPRTTIVRPSSSTLGSTSAVATAPQTALEPPSFINKNSWNDFMNSEGGVYDAWSSVYDSANHMGHESGMLDFTDLGANQLFNPPVSRSRGHYDDVRYL